LSVVRPRLSAVLIVRNEAARLRECLESVRWADEIVVVDTGSTDDTVAIAREFTTHVTSVEFSGFGPLKNRALDLATGDWILSIDADERVTPELRREIEAALANTDGPSGYFVPRLSYLCGRPMRHGGWWPDLVARLARRGQARFTDQPVHEELVIRGRTGRLSSPLVHFAYDDFEQVIEKLNRYSTLAAEKMFRAGRRAGVLTAIAHGAWSFFRTYVLQRGLLDGRHGLLLAVLNAEHSYYRYVKLWRLLERGRGSSGP
jgi:glycosyltransferase involved in cell wall biosynthesis